MTDIMDLKGRVALVTGARRGIGAAIAQRLAANCASVILAGRTAQAEGLEDVVARIRASGGVCQVLGFDVEDPAMRKGIIAEAEGFFGPIDILVNNAAFAGLWGPLSTVDSATLLKGLQVNALGPLDLIQQCLPGMRARKYGRILNVTSGMASQPAPPSPAAGAEFIRALAPYGVTKAAFDRMTTGLAAELLGTGVRVNAVMPSNVAVTGANSPGAMEILRRDPGRAEGMEMMAEAAILLICAPVTGLVMKSRDVLHLFDAPLHMLDGKTIMGDAHTIPDLPS